MTSEELDNRFTTLVEVTRDQNSQASNALNEGTEASVLRQLVSLTMNTNMTLLGIYSELVHAQPKLLRKIRRDKRR
jgi:hypothetical protein